MKTCSGVIVVAYERKFVTAGVEKRMGNTPKPIADLAFTTSWNHVESAMAFSLGLPLYIIRQRGLVEEGLIETKMDWFVQYVDISGGTFTKPPIAQCLKSWVDSRVKTRPIEGRWWRSVAGGLKISDMTPSEVYGAIVWLLWFSRRASLWDIFFQHCRTEAKTCLCARRPSNGSCRQECASTVQPSPVSLRIEFVHPSARTSQYNVQVVRG